MYRSEIDGLRAIAVVPVALFHAHVPGFGGGYAGVDVFFVISGYLITAILLSNRDRPGGLTAFYERRARRILPALLPVLAFTCAAAWIIFTPDDFRRYAQALAATALFASNMLFAMRSDYFAGEEGFEPLVHGWSLAVEEQFYLLYPLLLLFLVRRRQAAALPVILILLAASFALAVVLAGSAPRFAFNLLPTRGWELMAGAACALLPAPSRSRPVAGWLGLALIAAGFTTIAPGTPAPGPLFALPVVGAAIVLRYATIGTPVAALLGCRPLVGVGLVSYGFYLWHQALLAFVFYVHFEAPGWLLVGATLALALALAAASYRWIEQPVRRGEALISRRAFATACIAGLSIAAALGIAGHFKLFGPRMADDARRLDAVFAGPMDDTTILPPSGELPFLLYGDSHARQYYPALVASIGKGAMIAGSGCFSVPRATNWPPDTAKRAECIGQYSAARSLLQERNVGALIWAQRWERELYENDGGTAMGSTTSRAAALFREQLAAVRAELPARTRLVLVGNAPTAWASGPVMSRGLLRCRAWIDAECPTSYPAGRAEGRVANRILSAFAAATPSVTYVDAAAPLCPDGRCPILEDGRLYYSDGSHLTPYAAGLVAQRIAPAVALRGARP